MAKVRKISFFPSFFLTLRTNCGEIDFKTFFLLDWNRIVNYSVLALNIFHLQIKRNLSGQNLLQNELIHLPKIFLY